MPTQAIPRVTVLMTTRDGAAFIGESIASILAQSFADFELLVVDDASTDATAAILADCDDPRLRVLRSAIPLGVVGARNFGFAAAAAPYVAALDHDDLSHPERLARQVAYLDAHPEIVLVGTEVALLADGQARPTGHLPGASPLDLRWLLHIDNPLTYSSIMLRADAVRRLGAFMRPEMEYADDFDLYHRLLGIGGIARLDAVLTTYRWHGANTSHRARGDLSASAIAVLTRASAPWLGTDAEAASRLILRHLSDREPPEDAATLRRLGAIVATLLAGFTAAHAPLPEDAMRIARLAAHAWWGAVRGAVRRGHPLLLATYRGELARHHRPAPRDIVASLAIGALRRLGRASTPRPDHAGPR